MTVFSPVGVVDADRRVPRPAEGERLTRLA